MPNDKRPHLPGPGFQAHRASAKDHSFKADVCILGAGLAGLTTAYLLAREGRRVALFEAGQRLCDSRPVWATLTTWPPGGYDILAGIHGLDATRRVAASRQTALARIASIIGDERFDCDFQKIPGYFYAEVEHPDYLLEPEHEAARRAGLWDTVWWPRLPAPLRDQGRGLRFHNHGKFRADPYLKGLAEALTRMGGRVIADPCIESLEIGSTHMLRMAEGAKVESPVLVIATPTVIDSFFVGSGPNLKVATERRANAVTFEMPGCETTEAAVFLTECGRNALFIPKTGRAPAHLIIEEQGDEGPPQLSPQRRFAQLEDWARSHFDNVGTVVERHSHPFTDSFDGLPRIGHCASPGENPLSSQIFIASGECSFCPTQGMVAALLLRDLILGRHNDWQSVYAPNRPYLCPGLESKRVDAMEYRNSVNWDRRCRGRVAPRTGMIVRQALSAASKYTS